ncbi:MAG TPA: pentapeptide repeat-containing protein [Chitinophagaceae bacterium]|jgi:uncharacterized protein YjbI with pentapeptide repeats|nr:pentapeptide repeat-containing protein [Chitinophagaceae bacterium]
MEIISSLELEALLQSSISIRSSKYYRRETNSLDFNSLIIDARLDFRNSIDVSIMFVNCHFEDEVNFRHVDFKGKLWFTNCFFEGDVSFSSSDFSDDVFFEFCTAWESLNFSRVKFLKEIHFYGGFYKEIYFRKGEFFEVFIGDKESGTFFCKVSVYFSDIRGLFFLQAIVAFKLYIQGLIKSTDALSIIDCSIKHVAIQDFSNRGRFRINRLLPDSKEEFNSSKFQKAWDEVVEKEKNFQYSYVLIENAVLDNAEFFSIDFRKFNLLCVRESSLTGLSLSNTIWPEEIKHFGLDLIHKNDLAQISTKKSVSMYRIVRENYRQLKLASSKQGDVTQEQYFHGLEMSAYEKCLSWKNDFWTKLIIRLSYLTSNYGQSILRPLIWLLGGHLVFFLIGISTNGIEVNNFEQAFEKYFIYINPLHKLDDFLKGYLTIVDLVMRIWSSYMLYNIIRASRRFIK